MVSGRLPPRKIVPQISNPRTIATWMIAPRQLPHRQLPPRKDAPPTIGPEENCTPELIPLKEYYEWIEENYALYTSTRIHGFF